MVKHLLFHSEDTGNFMFGGVHRYKADVLRPGTQGCPSLSVNSLQLLLFKYVIRHLTKQVHLEESIRFTKQKEKTFTW